MATDNHPLWSTTARTPRKADMHQPLVVSVGIRFAQHGICIVGGQT